LATEAGKGQEETIGAESGKVFLKLKLFFSSVFGCRK
jgi:hypothetical protein